MKRQPFLFSAVFGIIFLAIIFFLPLIVRADLVELIDGHIHEGQVIAQNAMFIRLRTESDLPVREFLMSEVASITIDGKKTVYLPLEHPYAQEQADVPVSKLPTDQNPIPQEADAVSQETPEIGISEQKVRGTTEIRTDILTNETLIQMQQQGIDADKFLMIAPKSAVSVTQKENIISDAGEMRTFVQRIMGQKSDSLGAVLLLGLPILILVLLSALVAYILFALPLYLIARKKKLSAAIWAWVPIVQIFVLLKISEKPWWWFFLLCIPLVQIVFLIFIFVGLAEECGKPGWMGFLMILPVLQIIGLWYIALTMENAQQITDKPMPDPGALSAPPVEAPPIPTKVAVPPPKIKDQKSGEEPPPAQPRRF